MQLRPMTMDDADKMFEWKNYPETRQFSIVTKNEIDYDCHLKWLKENLEYFQIIETGAYIGTVLKDDEVKLPCGAIRIIDNEISVWVDKDFKNNGIASYILEKVSKKGMKAKIIDGNIASMRSFINAGFKPISYINHYYIFER